LPNPGIDACPNAEGCEDAAAAWNGLDGAFMKGFAAVLDDPVVLLIDPLAEAVPLAISMRFG
jgi:hypothetical protein